MYGPSTTLATREQHVQTLVTLQMEHRATSGLMLSRALCAPVGQLLRHGAEFCRGFAACLEGSCQHQSSQPQLVLAPVFP